MRARTLALVGTLTVAIAAAAATGGSVGGAERSSPAIVSLPIGRLESIARGTARALGDRSVRSGWAIATTKYAAEQATYPGSEPSVRHSPRAFLIAVRGRFVCMTCTFPPGAKPPRGIFAYDIWVPGEGISDSGLQPRVPAGLGKLGRVIRLRLG